MEKHMWLPEQKVQADTCFEVSDDVIFPNSIGLYVTPFASQDTLTGSMGTASQGIRSSVSQTTSPSEMTSGMASFSGQDVFFTPTTASFTSFAHSDMSSLDQIKYYSCHSNLRFLMENDNNESLENVLNEQKLKDLSEHQKNKMISSRSRASLFKSLYRNSSSKRKHGHEHLFETHTVPSLIQKTDVQTLVTSMSREQVWGQTKVIHGILKSSTSSDSGTLLPSKSTMYRVNQDSYKNGGKKALLIEKVSAVSILLYVKYIYTRYAL
ncbi:hypothetical protein DPMN_036446 [Dreissena polymorpha]|uniref:Uncharacterized protein n=1 Tax=Dreissena polymorpha TaxID=45954 RepID=A0A9D4M955_DREPO|nr:hypothetical protein DPMN_036446 [Dreissena polymorpha]